MLATGRVSDLLLGAGAPEATALVEGDRVLTYADLRDEVSQRAVDLDLPPRSLVVLGMSNTVEAVVTYLALLHGGHVPLLAGAHHPALADAWQPDAVLLTQHDGWTIERRPRARAVDLHRDLALLLSTSGSTGAPKLVRLSHENLASNAAAIGEYLALTPDDRGITSLPLHYCYGLSVLHSHLAAGAGMVITSASVVDPCFAAALRAGGVTNVAGVPHTFDLLDQAGPERVRVPTLRFLTQAGGRMPPDQVRTWLDRTAAWGVDLYVMYGQTEATARMAYLPPDLAHRHPGAIGHAIPGGHLELRPLDGAPADVGEIVYRGPNVMLGYATAPADLAEGSTLAELRTGDLGRLDPVDGVFEVVGRRARFVKPFGLRIDLDAIEGDLRAAGIDGVVTGDDDRIVVCAPDADLADVRRRVSDLTGLPLTAVVMDRGPVPRTPAGKVDHATLLARATSTNRPDAQTGGAAAVYATVLGRRDVSPASTFVDLGGDSLSYVECSVLLEERLGRLPEDWHLRRVDELDALGGRRTVPRLDTTALLRAVGVLLVLSTHMHLWYFPGGSHLMLAVVGYNACRFLFSIDGAADRATAVARSVARLAVPTVAFVAAGMVLVGGYGLPTLTLVNGYLGPASHLDGRWHYWFIEVAVQLLLLTTVLLAVGPVRRAEQRFPYAFPVVLLVAAVVAREAWVGENLRFQLHGVAWFFVLGWLVYRSTDARRKVLTTVICALAIPGFFGMPHREWLILGGLVLLVWCREIPLPRFAIRPIAVVAAASMAIYVTHFRIWRAFDDLGLARGWTFVATVLAGVAIWFAAERATRAVRRLRTARRLEVADVWPPRLAGADAQAPDGRRDAGDQRVPREREPALI